MKLPLKRPVIPNLDLSLNIAVAPEGTEAIFSPFVLASERERQRRLNMMMQRLEVPDDEYEPTARDLAHDHQVAAAFGEFGASVQNVMSDLLSEQVQEEDEEEIRQFWQRWQEKSDHESEELDDGEEDTLSAAFHRSSEALSSTFASPSNDQTKSQDISLESPDGEANLERDEKVKVKPQKQLQAELTELRLKHEAREREEAAARAAKRRAAAEEMSKKKEQEERERRQQIEDGKDGKDVAEASISGTLTSNPLLGTVAKRVYIRAYYFNKGGRASVAGTSLEDQSTREEYSPAPPEVEHKKPKFSSTSRFASKTR